MNPEAVSALPLWAQIIFSVAVALGLAGLTVWRYASSGAKGTAKSGEAQVVAGAIFDSNSMRNLTDTMRRADETTDRLERTVERAELTIRDAQRQHCECTNQNTDAIRELSRVLRARAGERS